MMDRGAHHLNKHFFVLSRAGISSSAEKQIHANPDTPADGINFVEGSEKTLMKEIQRLVRFLNSLLDRVLDSEYLQTRYIGDFGEKMIYLADSSVDNLGCINQVIPNGLKTLRGIPDQCQRFIDLGGKRADTPEIVSPDCIQEGAHPTDGAIHPKEKNRLKNNRQSQDSGEYQESFVHLDLCFLLFFPIRLLAGLERSRQWIKLLLQEFLSPIHIVRGLSCNRFSAVCNYIGTFTGFRQKQFASFRPASGCQKEGRRRTNHRTKYQKQRLFTCAGLLAHNISPLVY
jgi:hypothetical protein